MAADDFATRYGPWALIAGASDGVGAEYARAMAERGIDVLLLARRQELLEEQAAGLRERYGVDARPVVVDLAEPDAMARIVAATDGLDVGMVLYCAGADPNYEPFLDNPVESHLSLVQRNCVVPLQVCHHFARPMVARGSGGIVLVSSGAGLVGGPNVVTYGASKAFDMLLAEGLWAELHDQGVDVLSLVLGATDTPSLRRTLARRGMLADPDDPVDIPGLSTPAQVVAEALEHLDDGPSWMVGEQLRQGAVHLASLGRSEAVKVMVQSHAASVMNTDHAEAAG